MNNNFDFKMKDVIKDTQGNSDIMTLLTMDKEITLVNVQGPNKDESQFHERLQRTASRKTKPYFNSRGLEFGSEPIKPQLRPQ